MHHSKHFKHISKAIFQVHRTACLPPPYLPSKSSLNDSECAQCGEASRCQCHFCAHYVSCCCCCCCCSHCVASLSLSLVVWVQWCHQCGTTIAVVETCTSLCLYSTPFTFHLTALLLSLRSKLFLVAKTSLGLYWTMPSASGLLGLHC